MLYTVTMENPENDVSGTKKYPFKFTPFMLAVFYVALVLCAAGFGLTTWRFIGFLGDGADSVYQWIQYVILYFVSVFFSAVIVALLIRSQYVLTEDRLILQFGFIKQKYEIKSIYSVHLFKGLNKLADFRTKYTVIVVKEIWYDDFVKELMRRKPGIGFSFSTPEEEEEMKNKKK